MFKMYLNTKYCLQMYLNTKYIDVFKYFLRGSATQNLLIFQLCFTMLKMKLYVCRNLCENFRQIRQKMKKL